VNRAEWEHVIAAAAEVTDEDEIVVVGSQAILGPVPDAPKLLLRSMEADVYPRNAPDKAIVIDANLGDGSPFHREYGYYAYGVGPETAYAPEGWEERLVAVEVPARPRSRRRPVAYCLEPHDLVLAKCAANRDRDWDFARAAFAAGIVAGDELIRRAELLPLEAERLTVVRTMLAGVVDSVAPRRD
jgi:Nucleotidyltransferase of unknown function (DUF6036)